MGGEGSGGEVGVQERKSEGWEERGGEIEGGRKVKGGEEARRKHLPPAKMFARCLLERVPSLVSFSWCSEGRPGQLLTVQAIRTLLRVVLSTHVQKRECVAVSVNLGTFVISRSQGCTECKCPSECITCTILRWQQTAFITESAVIV